MNQRTQLKSEASKHSLFTKVPETERCSPLTERALSSGGGRGKKGVSVAGMAAGGRAWVEMEAMEASTR